MISGSEEADTGLGDTQEDESEEGEEGLEGLLEPHLGWSEGSSWWMLVRSSGRRPPSQPEAQVKLAEDARSSLGEPPHVYLTKE